MKIRWTVLAVEKLEEYGDYIALENPTAALKWTDSIRNSINRLKKFPQSGREVRELKRLEIRELIEGSYRIIYHVEKSHVTILTIRHSKQLLRMKDLHKKK